ncbi:MAG TPA: hypothetical protein VGM04_05610 [Sphingomicrobium sp.]|jgi:hypothetical protein
MRTSDSIDDGDRPATETEVTPAMLRAGAAIAASYVDMEWEAMRDWQRNMILSRVYRAMFQAGGA